ncbi:hypothetical protein [Psychrobacter immobilis]|nr:hypothetical protein [Psychrobacter immobilis]
MEKILQAIIKAVVTELAKVVVTSLNDFLSSYFSRDKGQTA